VQLKSIDSKILFLSLSGISGWGGQLYQLYCLPPFTALPHDYHRCPSSRAQCEKIARREEDRQWVQKRWQNMSARMWIGNMDNRMWIGNMDNRMWIGNMDNRMWIGNMDNRNSGEGLGLWRHSFGQKMEIRTWTVETLLRPKNGDKDLDCGDIACLRCPAVSGTAARSYANVVLVAGCTLLPGRTN